MIRFVAFFVMFAAALPVAAGCSPDSMLRIEFRNLAPGTDPDSFSAKHKTFYRFGADRARWEEPLDDVNNVHALVVVNGNDTWMADRAQNAGSHFVKSAGDPPLMAPVIGVQGLPEAIYAIELGCEVAFMRDKAIEPSRIQVQGLDYDEYVWSVPPLEARLLVRPDKNTPSALAVYEGELLRHLVQYRKYDALEVDDSLFVKPEGIRFATTP